MTPFQIEILFNYNCGAQDFRNADFSAPILPGEIDLMCNLGLLSHGSNPKFPDVNTLYHITILGELMVSNICAVPLPEMIVIS